MKLEIDYSKDSLLDEFSLRTLEESYQVFLTPTGFGSVFLSIFSVVRPGDEILLSDPIYSPTRLLTENYLNEFNRRKMQK